MKILVTGATGGLGKRILPALLERDDVHMRVLMHRSPAGFPACEEITGALEDKESLLKATTGIDTVLHLAAMTHSRNPDDYFRVNLEGTKNLLEACAQNKVRRFIFMSSGAAHADGGVYSASKLQAEQSVKQSGLAWAILKPREVYGSGGKEGINQLIHWIRKFKVAPVFGDGRYSISPVFIDDVVNATAAAVVCDADLNQTFTLAGPEEMSTLALIDRLAEYFGVTVKKIRLPLPMLKGMAVLLNALKIEIIVADQIPRLLCEKPSDWELAFQRLNFKPRTLEEGLSLCFPEKNQVAGD